MTKRHSSFGLCADYITEYKEQTVNEVQILGANGLTIMVSFQPIESSHYERDLILGTRIRAWVRQ